MIVVIEPVLFVEPQAKAQTATKKTARTAKQSATAKPLDIDKNGVVILVKSAMLALDQANKTGNYTVRRDLGSIGFQHANTGPCRCRRAGSATNTIAASCAERHASHGGLLPLVPTQVNFEMLWEPVKREWSLYGLSVNLSTGGPKAPDVPLPDPPPIPDLPPQPPSASVTVTPSPIPKQ